MSYDLGLLTSLWLIPLIGIAIVLIIPNRNASAIRWAALGCTVVTFIASLVALGNYLTDGEARKTLEERAANNVARAETTATNSMPAEGTATQGNAARITESFVITEDGRAQSDLVVRRPWIPSFNIQ
jgi:NADH-quinone oxidoreductase subunit M